MIVLVPVAAERPIVSEFSIAVPPAGSAADACLVDADRFARNAANLLAQSGVGALAQYDSHPAPLYAIDPDGDLIYYNDACIAMAGRTPQVGRDRYCLCAAIYTLDGEPVDYPTGPMATVLEQARPLRDLKALVERPDGERCAVKAYPTPALDDQGSVVGAINVVVPLDGAVFRDLTATSLRCRTLAKWISDPQANQALTRMADECAEQAHILRPR